MSDIKIGIFIKKLREEKGISQEKLARDIYVTRAAISKWERGKGCPDKESLILLSKYFEVSIDELLYGERKNKSNTSKMQSMIIDIYDKKNKFKKWFIISLVILVILLCCFLSFFIYYFLSTYDTLSVYLVTTSGDYFMMEDGQMLLDKEHIFINTGEVTCKEVRTSTGVPCDEEVIALELYLKKNNEYELLFKSNKNYLFLSDFNGYHKFFDPKHIDSFTNNLYLKIITDKGNSYDNWLAIEQLYSNKELSFK